MILTSEQETAEILRIAPVTLRGWRMRGQGPPWVKIEGTIRYVDVVAWVEAQVVLPPSQEDEDE